MWTRPAPELPDAAKIFPGIDSERALVRIRESIRATPIVPLPPAADPGLVLLGKLENRQETGSFKARGALNNVLMLDPGALARGVVASSSGNHGRALAWAARRAGVEAAIVMPANAYTNKIEACRAEGAEVVLAEDRWRADEIAAELADPDGRGLEWVHPYDRPGTVEGAGTVGVEIARDLADDPPDAVVICVGGGGLAAGTALALRRAFGGRVAIFGAEPVGAATMSAGLRTGAPVRLERITSEVQGLTPPSAGVLNVQICRDVLDGVVTLDDAAIFAAQRRLVHPDPSFTAPGSDAPGFGGPGGWQGEVVEPAGAAAYAAALSDGFAERVRTALAARGHAVPEGRPLRVVVTVSGGNPSPSQLAEIRAAR